MKTEMGEYVVGAYLKIILGCDFVDYNVRVPEEGLKGLNEIDVIGLDFKNKTAYLCEVVTHLRGALYKDNKTTVKVIKKKYENLKDYAKKYLKNFSKHHFMLWSPVVPKGYITQKLERIKGLELIINEKYTKCIEELREKAQKTTRDTGNPFFRVLQILEHLRK